jgi:hypothetical protein
VAVTALSMFYVYILVLWLCHRLLNHEDRADDVHPCVSHKEALFFKIYGCDKFVPTMLQLTCSFCRRNDVGMLAAKK